MQYNNNQSIADKLQTMSQNIIEASEDNNINQAIETIQKEYKQIDLLAQEFDVPILRTIAHWMELNLEINSDNNEKITALLEQKSYSNWLDVLISLIRKHDTQLYPKIHHNLTSPNWIVKPSIPLLTGLASWLSALYDEEKLANIESSDEDTSDNILIENLHSNDREHHDIESKDMSQLNNDDLIQNKYIETDASQESTESETSIDILNVDSSYGDTYNADIEVSLDEL